MYYIFIMYIQMHTHKVYILKIFTCVCIYIYIYIFMCVCMFVCLFLDAINRLIALEKKEKMCTQISESVCKDFNTSVHQMQVGIMNKWQAKYYMHMECTIIATLGCFLNILPFSRYFPRVKGSQSASFVKCVCSCVLEVQREHCMSRRSRVTQW